MKPFYEFEQYMADHLSEIRYDAISKLKPTEYPNFFNADVTNAITNISISTLLAVLRAYHNWSSEEE